MAAWDEHLLVPEAILDMIVDHAGRLHVGIHDGRTHELESPLAQVQADGVGLRIGGLVVRPRADYVDDRFPAHESPDIGIEGSEFLLLCAFIGNLSQGWPGR